jgi:hypothetical protein
MTRLGIVKNFPDRFPIPAGVGTQASGYHTIHTVDLSDLTSGSSVELVFIITGRIGEFDYLPGSNVGTVDIQLGDSVGTAFANYTHSTWMAASEFAYGENRGHQFTMVMQSAGWNISGGVDLEIRGRVQLSGLFAGAPAAMLDDVGVVVMDLDAWTTSHYAIGSTLGTTTSLGRWPLLTQLTQSGTVPWVSGTEKWLVFGAARMTPDIGACNVAIVKQSLGTWVSSAETWGRETEATTGSPLVHGGNSFGGHGTATPDKHWSGLWHEYDVVNATTTFGLYGQNRNSGGAVGVANDAILVAFRAARDMGYMRKSAAVDYDFYRTPGVGASYKESFTSSYDYDGVLMHAGTLQLNAGPAASCRTSVLQNSVTPLNNTTDGLHVITNNIQVGQTDHTIAPVEVYKGANVPELRGTTLAGEAGGIGILSIVDAVTSVLYGAAYEQVELTVVGYHGLIPGVGTNYNVTIAGTKNNPLLPREDLNGTWPSSSHSSKKAPARAVEAIVSAPTGLTLLIDKIVAGTVTGSHSAALGGSMTVTINQGRVWQAFQEVVYLALDDTTSAATTPETESDAVPGVVQLTPSGEAPGLDFLTALPIEPSFPMSVELFSDREDFDAANGYRITWPTFHTPRRLINVSWRGITTAQRDTLRTFFDGLGLAAFKWTLPHDIVRPYVLTKRDRGEVDTANGTHTMTATFTQLVYLV